MRLVRHRSRTSSDIHVGFPRADARILPIWMLRHREARIRVSTEKHFLSGQILVRAKNTSDKKWLLWDSNPRHHASEARALDHSAKQPVVAPAQKGRVSITCCQIDHAPGPINPQKLRAALQRTFESRTGASRGSDRGCQNTRSHGIWTWT